MKVSVIQRADGGISYAPIVRQQGEDESDAAFLEACTRRLLAANPGSEIVGIQEATALPEYDEFRDAWAADKGQVVVDMPKARDLHMGRIRVARDEKLKALDIETMKGNDVQAEKQALRDIPQTFDLSTAKTPEALKALWPEELR